MIMISPDPSIPIKRLRESSSHHDVNREDNFESPDESSSNTTTTSNSSEESLVDDNSNPDTEAVYNAFLPFIRHLGHDPTPTPTPWVPIRITYDRDNDVYICRCSSDSPTSDVMSLLLGGENCFILRPVYKGCWDGIPTGDVEFLRHRGSYMGVLGWQGVVEEVNEKMLPFDAVVVERGKWEREREGMDGGGLDGSAGKGVFWIRRVSGEMRGCENGWVNPMWSLEISKRRGR